MTRQRRILPSADIPATAKKLSPKEIKRLFASLESSDPPPIEEHQLRAEERKQQQEDAVDLVSFVPWEDAVVVINGRRIVFKQGVPCMVKQGYIDVLFQREEARVRAAAYERTVARGQIER